MEIWVVLVWFTVVTSEYGGIDTIPVPLLYEYHSQGECEGAIPALSKPAHGDQRQVAKKELRCIRIVR